MECCVCGNNPCNCPRINEGEYACMIQDIKINADLDRRPVNELGCKGPYYKYVRFPIYVTWSDDISFNEITSFAITYDQRILR